MSKKSTHLSNRIFAFLMTFAALGLSVVLMLQIGLLYEAKALCRQASLLMAQAVAEKGLDKEEMQIAFARGLAPLYAHLSKQTAADSRLKNRAVQAAYEDARKNLEIVVTTNKAKNTAYEASQQDEGKPSLVRVETVYAYQPLPIFQDLTLKVWAYYFSDEVQEQAMLRGGRMPIRNTVTLNRVVETPKSTPPKTNPAPVKERTDNTKISV